MGAELCRGFGGRGLGDRMLFVTGQMGQDGTGERPAGPGAGAAGFGPRTGEAASVMLEMHPWVADEPGGGGVAQQPHERGIGWRPLAQHRFVAAQLGPERAVEAEDGAGGKAALPKGVSVFETVVIKLRAPHVLAMDMERAPVQPGAGRWEVWAGRDGSREQGKSIRE